MRPLCYLIKLLESPTECVHQIGRYKLQEKKKLFWMSLVAVKSFIAFTHAAPYCTTNSGFD